jgi:DNA-binding response OmpR family regulator
VAEKWNAESKSSPLPGKRPRLLIVDADQLDRQNVGPQLLQHGYVVDYVSHGEQALEAIKSRPFDLVLANLSLPDMPGSELSRRVRAWETENTHMPIIALCDGDLPVQPIDLLKCGIDDYIPKPYDARQIARIVGIYAGSTRAIREDSPDLYRLADSLDTTGAIEVFFAGNPEDYREMLQLFLGRLPERMQRIRGFFDDGSYEHLAREFHSIKSIGASLGALQLSQLAGWLEQRCEDGQIGSHASAVREIESVAATTESEARAFLQSYP